LSFSISGLKKVTTRPSLSPAACGRDRAPGGTSTNAAIRGLAPMAAASGERGVPVCQADARWLVHQVVQRQLDQLPGGALDRPQDDTLPVHSMDVLARPFLSAHAGCCAAADVGARGARVRAIARIVGSRRWQAPVPASGNRPA
jgi:hypothetical protein